MNSSDYDCVNFNEKDVYFVALGGVGQVGMNLYLYGYKNKWIVVDVGLGFTGEKYPGIDVIYADIDFIKKNNINVEAIFITHAHEDHYGAIGIVYEDIKAPIYASKFASLLIKERLSEFGFERSAKIHVVADGERVKVADFDVQFSYISHSVPETSALIIRTDCCNIVHATDWKSDCSNIQAMYTNKDCLKQIAEEGVDYLFSDLTNILVEGKIAPEEKVRENLKKIIAKAKNKLVTTCFSSNLVRLESLVIAATEAGRTPVLVGRSIIRNLRLAKEAGYFRDMPEFLTDRDIKDLKFDKLVFICTGSQGDYRGALSRIATGSHKLISVEEGDTVIFSSRIIPGNENRILYIQNLLTEKKANIITVDTELVHTSGHAGRQDIKEFYELLKPKSVIPVHGEQVHIHEHVDFLHENGIENTLLIKNGEVIALSKDGVAKHYAEVFVDIIGVDRHQVISLNSELIRNRKKIAFNCSAFITAILDKDYNVIKLKLSSLDLVDETEAKILFPWVEDHIVGVI